MARTDCRRPHSITYFRWLQAQSAGAHRDAYTEVEKWVIANANSLLIAHKRSAQAAGRGDENTERLGPVASDATSAFSNDPPSSTELRAEAADRLHRITEERKRLEQMMGNKKIAIPKLFGDLINLAVAVGEIKGTEAHNLRKLLDPLDLIRLSDNSSSRYEDAKPTQSPPEL